MMDNKNIQNTPNISNVVEVIKSNTNMINAVLKNIITASSVVEKIDIKKFQENTRKFNDVSSIMDTYLDVLDSVLNSISKTSSNKIGLDEMLHYYEKVEISNTDGKNIKNIKSGYRIIDATSQLGILFKNIVDSINNLGGLGGKENMLSFYLKTKVASEMIKSTLEDMLTTIVDAITGINTDKLSKAQQLLIGDPEVVEQINDIIREDSKDKNGSTGSSLIDLSKTKTIKAKQGLLEGISTIFAIINSVTNFSLNPLKFILFKFKLKIIRTHIIEILKMMNNLVPPAQRKSIRSGLEFLIGDGQTPGVLGDEKDSKNGIMGLIACLNVIVNKIKKTAIIFGIKQIHELMSEGLSNIMGYIKTVLQIVNNKYTKNLLGETLTGKSPISQLSKLFDQLSGLATSLLQIAFKGLILTTMEKFVVKTVDILLNIVEKISTIFVKFNSQNDLNIIIDQIKNLKDIFVNLNILALVIIGFAVITTPAIIAAFLSIGFIWALMWCLKGIIFILELFPDKAIRNISKDILKLAIIFYSLIAIELALIAVAAIIEEYWELMLFGLIGTIILLGLAIGALRLISLATKKGLDIKTMLALLLLTAILGALTIVMLLLVGISFIVQYIEWSALGKALLLFVAVLGVLIVIGALLSFGSSILLPIAGILGISIAIIVGILIGMLSIFAIILGVQKTILEIQNIKINKKLLIQKIEDLFSIVFEVTGSILDKRLGESGDGTFIKLRRAKRLLNKINKVFDKLVGVARSLTELSKITIPNNVSDKIQLLFNTIFGEKDDDKSFAIVPIISKMEELVEKRKTTRKAKRLLKQVCGVTEQLANISKSLNDIANFNIEESAIQSGLTKIFNTVDFVQQQIDEKLIKVDENTTERAKRRALRQNKKKMRQAAKALGKADEVLMEIESIVDSFNNIKDFKLEKSTIETAISGIFANIDSFIQMIDKNTIGGGVDMNSGDFEDKLDALERISSIIRGFIPESDEVDRHKNFIENNIKFLGKINDINLEKLQTSEHLFARMAEFSKTINGNFEDLANSLNEKIAPLLEELKELMDKKQNKSTQNSLSNTNQSVETVNNETINNEQKLKDINISIDDVADKINDMISILRTQTIKVETV